MNILGSPTLKNCTFTSNSADYGGGMYIQDSSPTVTNCILWGNNATSGTEAYKIGVGTSEFIHCDIKGSGGSGAKWNSTLGADGGGNINKDPQFADPFNPAGPDGIWMTADDGLALLANSPCINIGRATDAPTTDILGNPRVGLPDIGSYEFKINSPILRYLLGLDTDPTGLDTNGDTKVDIADLVKSLKAPH